MAVGFAAAVEREDVCVPPHGKLVHKDCKDAMGSMAGLSEG